MSESISPLVGNAVGWMYGNRALLSEGYSGKDPGYEKAKAAFLKGMSRRYPDETEEALIKAFYQALNMV